MSWYKTGSVTATSGSKIITGAGTQFTNPLNGVSAGRMLLLPGAGTVQIYEIESVQSDTQLTLVSAFPGTTGSGKSYAIPTSPSISIEQFAHEFASTLAYYQQQLQGWQSILTGTGNITLTTPDGQSVTVRSQAEWDRLLNTKIGAGEFGIGGVLDLRNSPFIGLPSSIYGRGTIFGICNGSAIGLPEYPLVTLILNGSWNDVTGHTAINRIAISGGDVLVQQAMPTSNEWGEWCKGWNNKNLINPLTEGGEGQWITGLKSFRRNGEAFRIIALDAFRSSYIISSNAAGDNRWFVGNGSDNSNTATFYNYKSNCALHLVDDGSINLATPKKAQVNNVDILLAGDYGFGGNGGSINIADSAQFTDYLRSQPSRIIRNNNETTLQKAYSAGILLKTADTWAYFCADPFGGYVQLSCGTSTASYSHNFWTNRNTTVSSGGAILAASPVINIYTDGSFTANDEAAGVNVERLSEGVYKITGCQGMNADPAWNGIDGGVKNPVCRNGLELTWNDFSVESDGSVIVRAYHRPHPDAISFARNEIEGYENGDPIDVPKGLFIQVRVNMPERSEPKPVISHSNACNNTVSPA